MNTAIEPAQTAVAPISATEHWKWWLPKCSAGFPPFLCCVALLVCIALAHPFANSAFNDDWSYSHVALKLAETGRLQYNGWGSPMALFQILWGAAWIRLFGFSFDILRVATIPFSLGFVLLVYALARRAGLRRDLALFAGLTVGTSPLFVPLSVSFMTEAYCCFFTMLCLYAAIASTQAAAGVIATRWLWVLAISGIVGGSDRQIVWALPLALIPYLVWVRRSDMRFAGRAVIAYILCIVAVVLFTMNLSQPYAPLELSIQQFTHLVRERWLIAIVILAMLGLSCLLVTLPALLCAGSWSVLLRLRRAQIHENGGADDREASSAIFDPATCLKPGRRQKAIVCPTHFEKSALGSTRWIVSGVIAAISTASLVAILGIEHGLAPFFRLGNILTPVGIMHPGHDAVGARPVVLPLLLRIALTWLLLFAVAAFGHLFRQRREPLPGIPTTVFSIHYCSYILLLIPGTLVGLNFDRYALPLFPVLVIFILLSLQSQTHRIPFAAWACLALFAAYSVATTHDYFSGLRARALAAQTLENLHSPRNHISSGIEYDGWTQLEFVGRIKTPLYGDPGGNATNSFWFWSKATAIHPDYVVSYWSPAQLPDKRLVTVPFQTWLPPFRWTVVALAREDLITVTRRGS